MYKHFKNDPHALGLPIDVITGAQQHTRQKQLLIFGVFYSQFDMVSFYYYSYGDLMFEKVFN